jgi:hypothetical protein
MLKRVMAQTRASFSSATVGGRLPQDGAGAQQQPQQTTSTSTSASSSASQQPALAQPLQAASVAPGAAPPAAVVAAAAAAAAQNGVPLMPQLQALQRMETPPGSPGLTMPLLVAGGAAAAGAAGPSSAVTPLLRSGSFGGQPQGVLLAAAPGAGAGVVAPASGGAAGPSLGLVFGDDHLAGVDAQDGI